MMVVNIMTNKVGVFDQHLLKMYGSSKVWIRVIMSIVLELLKYLGFSIHQVDCSWCTISTGVEVIDNMFEDKKPNVKSASLIEI